MCVCVTCLVLTEPLHWRHVGPNRQTVNFYLSFVPPFPIHSSPFLCSQDPLHGRHVFRPKPTNLDFFLCFFSKSFITYNSHHKKLSAGRKNRSGAKGASAWPEDQKRHLPPLSIHSSPFLCSQDPLHGRHVLRPKPCDRFSGNGHSIRLQPRGSYPQHSLPLFTGPSPRANVLRPEPGAFLCFVAVFFCFSVSGLSLSLFTALPSSVHRTLSTGDMSFGPNRATVSPAMDIQFAYNLERLLYFCSGQNLFSSPDRDLFSSSGPKDETVSSGQNLFSSSGQDLFSSSGQAHVPDTALVGALMRQLETSGAAVLPTKLLSAVQSTFSSVAVSDEEVHSSCY